MNTKFPKISLPGGETFTSNRSGMVTSSQIDRIRMYQPEPSGYRIGLYGFLMLFFALVEVVLRSGLAFEMINGWGRIAILIGGVLAGAAFFYFLWRSLSEASEERRRKRLALRDIDDGSIREAEGTLSITPRFTPGIQTDDRVLPLLPNSRDPHPSDQKLSMGKRYRVLYLEKSCLVLSAEEIGPAGTENFDTYRLALAGKVQLHELARNRTGKLSGRQKLNLYQGMGGFLFFSTCIMGMLVLLLGPTFSDFVHSAPPGTLYYYLLWFSLEIFPLGAIGLVLVGVWKEPFLITLDLALGQLQAASGTLIKPFAVTEMEMASRMFWPRIKIDGRILKIPKALYPLLVEGQAYRVYHFRWSKRLVSVEALLPEGRDLWPDPQDFDGLVNAAA